MLLFYNPWKHHKTFRFSDVFRGYRKATPGCNGLRKKTVQCHLVFILQPWMFSLVLFSHDLTINQSQKLLINNISIYVSDMKVIFMLAIYLYNITFEDEKLMNKLQKFIKNKQISISDLTIHNRSNHSLRQKNSVLVHLRQY